jgi:hypothetical protein
METGLTDADLAFRHHAGPHTFAPNWPVHRVRGAAVQDEEVA